MRDDVLDTLFSIDLEYKLSDCYKTGPDATEGGKGGAEAGKHGRKLFSGLWWLAQLPVSYNLAQ